MCPIITKDKIFILTFIHIGDVPSINNPNFANRIPLQKNEDTKGVIRNRKSKKERQYNDQEDKQRSTKQYTDNYRSSTTNNTKLMKMLTSMVNFLPDHKMIFIYQPFRCMQFIFHNSYSNY